MLMEQASGYRSLRAPQGDGQKLIEPPLAELPQVVAENRVLLSRAECDLQGRSLADLSRSARGSLLALAAAYTRQYRDVSAALPDPATLPDTPFILAGHQPQLFHPGVWYKNFVLGELANSVDGVGVHLLIDSDLCRSASIRVPAGSLQHPRVEAVAYDEPAPELPYEERHIRDFDTLRSFAGNVLARLRPLVDDPLVTELWPLLLERNSSQMNLGLRLAQGRHALEQTWNLNSLELPQSAVCQLPEFAWFLAHVLAHLPRLWAAHNDALADYRLAHRMRNRAHPVPDLVEIDGWLEAPFWIWSADDPRRLPLFAKQAGDELKITDRRGRNYSLPLNADRDASAAVEKLLEIASRGVKIRTRALTTTLFARLVLSDVFLHGIGGAKYDQVTDQIAHAFFGFTPPQFATISATLRLPIASSVGPLHERSCHEQLRELHYHPERAIESDGLVSSEELLVVRELIAKKRRWIKAPKTPQNARQRHLGITGANAALQPFLAERKRQIKSRCNELQHRKRAEAILQSREYSFCLHPREHFERLLS